MNRPNFEQKIVHPLDIDQGCIDLPRPIVFTNGVFDILHRGHATYLAQARALGASLVVAANSDASVKRLGKGADRPINELEDRLALLAALESTDRVTWFEEDTPIEVIRKLKPDWVVKGGDWPIDKIVGGEEAQAWGGKVASIPFEFERSTTSLLGRIRRAGTPPRD